MRPEVKAALAFIEKMVKAPGELTPADAGAARAAGVPDDGLRDAIYVCANFSLIVRIADTLEFDLPPAEAFRAMGRNLLKRGYIM